MTYLSRALPLLKVLFDHKCAFEVDEWEIGRGQKKLEGIRNSLAYDALDNRRVNMMLKKEVNIVQFATNALPTKARGIQFCTNLRTAYQNAVEQTSFCHALADATATEVQYEGIDFCVRYTAAMDPAQIAEFATDCENRRAAFPYSLLDERDGKNWDANVQAEHRAAMADFYGTISDVLRQQATEQISVKGSYHGQGVSVRYSVNGTVKSGHWDTSSGNGALNIEITVQAICRLPPRIRPRMVRGLVMGDDLLLWVYFDHEVSPCEYAGAINALEADLGIHPVRGLFQDVLNVSFCSMGFYWTTSGRLAVVPKLGRCFAKLFWTVTPLQNRAPERMASTIAHAFYPLYHEYEPMRVFLQHHMKAPPIEVENAPWLSYVWRDFGVPRFPGINWGLGNLVKYGLPLDALFDMAEVLSGFESGLIDHPIVNIMLQQDMADPPERRGVLA